MKCFIPEAHCRIKISTSIKNFIEILSRFYASGQLQNRSDLVGSTIVKYFLHSTAVKCDWREKWEALLDRKPLFSLHILLGVSGFGTHIFCYAFLHKFYIRFFNK